MTEKRHDPQQSKGMNQSIDFSQLRLGVDSPYCSKCGIELTLDARKGIWTCRDKSHDIIFTEDWNTVLLHAATANKILELEGIEMVTYCGVAIERTYAVSPSHLLPLIVQASLERVEALGKPQSFALTCIEITETQTPGSLTELMVRVNMANALPEESLKILNSVVSSAITTCRAESPFLSVMDAHCLLNPRY